MARPDCRDDFVARIAPDLAECGSTTSPPGTCSTPCSPWYRDDSPSAFANARAAREINRISCPTFLTSVPNDALSRAFQCQDGVAGVAVNPRGACLYRNMQLSPQEGLAG